MRSNFKIIKNIFLITIISIMGFGFFSMILRVENNQTNDNVSQETMTNQMTIGEELSSQTALDEDKAPGDWVEATTPGHPDLQLMSVDAIKPSSPTATDGSLDFDYGTRENYHDTDLTKIIFNLEPTEGPPGSYEYDGQANIISKEVIPQVPTHPNSWDFGNIVFENLHHDYYTLLIYLEFTSPQVNGGNSFVINAVQASEFRSWMWLLDDVIGLEGAANNIDITITHPLWGEEGVVNIGYKITIENDITNANLSTLIKDGNDNTVKSSDDGIIGHGGSATNSFIIGSGTYSVWIVASYNIQMDYITNAILGKKTFTVNEGIEVKPEARMTSHNVTNVTDWGLNDGKIAVDYQSSNEYNANFTKYRIELHDANRFVDVHEPPTTNPGDGVVSGSYEFAGLKSGTYKLKLVIGYTIDGVSGEEIYQIISSIVIDEGKEIKPEADITLNKTTDTTKWGSDDGKIAVDYQSSNEYNANFTKYRIELWDNANGLVDVYQPAKTNPGDGIVSGLYEFTNLKAVTYELKLVIGYTIDGVSDEETYQTIPSIVINKGVEAKPEANITLSNKTDVTDWGLNDGKIAVNYQSSNEHNANFTKYRIELYNANGFVDVYEPAKTNPGDGIVSGSYEFTSLEPGFYELKLVIGYTIEGVSGEDIYETIPSIEIKEGREFKPEASITSHQTTDTTKWGLDDGKISVDYQSSNEYNANFTKYRIELWDNAQGFINVHEPAKTNPGQGIVSGSYEFTNLKPGIYEIRLVIGYEINNGSFQEEEYEKISSIEIKDGIDIILEADITSHQTTNVTDWGLEDGKIAVDYQSSNEYGANFTEYRIELYDNANTSTPVQIHEPAKTNPGDGTVSGSHEFTDLKPVTYHLKLVIAYDINGNFSGEQIYKTVPGIIINEGIEIKPEAGLTFDNKVDVTNWGLDDGKMTIDHWSSNEYNANFTKYQLQLYDLANLSTPVQIYEAAKTNPGDGTVSDSHEFTNLKPATYEVRLVIGYDINGGNFQEEIYDTTNSIEIKEGDELPPSLSNGMNIIVEPSSSVLVHNGIINFDFMILNEYNAKIDYVEVELTNNENPLVVIDNETFLNPNGNDVLAGKFENLNSGEYGIRVITKYHLVEGGMSQEYSNEILHKEENIVVIRKTHKPYGKFENVISEEQIDDERLGSISFDYKTWNPDNVDIEKMEINLIDINDSTNNQTLPIDTNRSILEESSKFVVGVGEYEIEMLSTFTTSEGVLNSDIIINKVSGIIVQQRVHYPLTATKTPHITMNTFNITINIIDTWEVVVEGSMKVEVKINEEVVDYQENLTLKYDSGNIPYNEANIQSYEVRISLEIYNDKGQIEEWSGGEEWEIFTWYNGIEYSSENILVPLLIIGAIGFLGASLLSFYFFYRT